MTSAIDAAQLLVKKLNMPAQYHSIFVRTETGNDGEFDRTLCVSWNPGVLAPPELPNEFMGHPIEVVEWPKGL
jgi:hypothetical protein